MELVRDNNDRPITFEMQITGETVAVQIWKLHVGRIPLYLLDTNLNQNSPEARQITARLYAGGQDLRLRQEILWASAEFLHSRRWASKHMFII